MSSAITSSEGRVIRSYGRRFIVEIENQEYDSTTRGKRVDYVCGDYVEVTIQNHQQAVIETLHPRKSLLYRQDQRKVKMIAANVTRLLFVIAAVPTPSEELLNRCLIAAESANIEPIIVVNKIDLPETAKLLERLSLYQRLGYPMIMLCALDDKGETLAPILEGHTGVLVGQSGMGKSTLINALLPNAQARTGAISEALDSGRHTTTHAALFHLTPHSHLIDSPGLQEFGLSHIEIAILPSLFPEMRVYLGQCRFHNCTHRMEPGCAIKQATEQGFIHPLRLHLLQKLIDSQALIQ